MLKSEVNMGKKLYEAWMNKSKSEKRKIIKDIEKDYGRKLSEEDIEEIIICLR